MKYPTETCTLESKNQMYIVAIAWLYVVLMMAITERSVIGGILTFFFYGARPLALFWWLVGFSIRKRRARLVADQRAHQPDGTDSQRDQGDLL